MILRARAPTGNRSSLALLAALALALLLGWPAGAARSDEAGAAATSDEVLGHRRRAAAYLRTQNADLALVEIEALAARLDGEARVLATAARKAADAGDFPAAAASIARLRDLLAEERRRRGLRIPADCILEASRELAAVDPGRTSRPDISRPDIREAVRRNAALASAALARCDAEAPRAMAGSPEFRRLVDGARSSLAQVVEAAGRGEPDLLHRLLIELRSFDQLLLQRYG